MPYMMTNDRGEQDATNDKGIVSKQSMVLVPLGKFFSSFLLSNHLYHD